MKSNSIVNCHHPATGSSTRTTFERWTRRVKHLRHRTATKLLLAVRRVTGGPDYLSELIFWENALAGRPGWISDRHKWARAFPDCLRSRLAEHRAARKVRAQVLEVGSGPVSILASGVEEESMTVTAVDPLARLYRTLLREYGIEYPIVPIEGAGESLGEQFKYERFDIVYSSNALDHTKSPRKCLAEMSKVLREGGLIALEGFEREASNAGWSGLHQHDLLPEEGHLVRYDRHGRRENLTEDLGLKCVHQQVVQFKDRGIDGFGYELPPGTPADANWHHHDWYTIVFRK
jgi:SAM-dependent methyltransferase